MHIFRLFLVSIGIRTVQFLQVRYMTKFWHKKPSHRRIRYISALSIHRMKHIYQMSSDKKNNFTDKGGRQKGIKASYILIMWSLDGEHLMPFQSQGSESGKFQLDMTNKGSLYIAAFNLLRASTDTSTTTTLEFKLRRLRY